MFGFNFQEIVYLAVLIFLLNASGIWPVLMRSLRDLRGDSEPEQRPRTTAPPSGSNLEMCYRLLGISSSAPWDEIERAYRAKAKKHHPDHGGDEDAMRALNEAYSLLKQARGSR